MSYILEALKKAESERERGVVPGLNSGQTNHTTYISYGNGARPWWVLPVALGVLLALVAAIWVLRQPAISPPLALPPVAVAPVSPVLEASATPPNRTVMPVIAQVVPPPAAEVARPVHTAHEVPAPPQVPAPAAPVPAAPVPAALPTPAPTTPVAKTTPGPASAGRTGIPHISELPDSVRRQIPALAISGAIYSDSPAEWTLIVNDQVMGRGSMVAPDVRLEDISASSAVFNFKGQRFRIEH